MGYKYSYNWVISTMNLRVVPGRVKFEMIKSTYDPLGLKASREGWRSLNETKALEGRRDLDDVDERPHLRAGVLKGPRGL